MLSALGLLTLCHVAISLIGIGSGVIVMDNFICGRRREFWANLFLVSTFLASASAFAFPIVRLLPSHVVAILSLLIVGIAFCARTYGRMIGQWRVVFVVSSIAALYLNVFVLLVQLFLRIPALKAMAPTQSETVFLLCQFIVLACFILLGRLAAKSHDRIESRVNADIE